MELELIRTYRPEGTNGNIFISGKFFVYSIELPWKDNHARVSCIPEGKYALVKRYSPKLHWHFELLEVPERTCILMHAANDALAELQGCIAPVSILTAAGKGLLSKRALSKLISFVYPELDKNADVFIHIKS